MYTFKVGHALFHLLKHVKETSTVHGINVAVTSELVCVSIILFFFQAEDGIRDSSVTGVQTCALPIYRRIDNNNFSYTPGTFTFTTVNAFLADQASAFTANPSNTANRIFVNSIGAFVQDSWRLKPNFMLSLGLRYDWFGTPTEGASRFVVFDPSTISLVHSNN